MFFSVFAVALLAEGVDRNDFDTLVEELDATVALLAEGVDRNTATLAANPYVLASPSSRRAWIEMQAVAAATATATRRPPRGGRG